MTNIKQFTFIFGTVILSSCTTVKYLSSTIKPSEIIDLQQFETFSYITLIEKGNQGKYSDTLSIASKELFSEVLSSFGDRIPFTGDISVNGTIVQNKIEREIEYLCVTADKKKNISNLKLTPALDSLLESSHHRFGLITVTTGFTRVKGNYGKQIAKGIGLAVFTLGMMYVAPIKSQSTIYAMIIDSKDNNVAFFRKSFLQDKEPLDETVLKMQVQDIFNGYFWAVKK